jgi:hypothetical protein
MKELKPAQFPCLTSLHLSCCDDLSNDCLLLLAPQLESLHLDLIRTDFDITAVTSEDKCFTKLKVLTLIGCKIDAPKIVRKCFITLKHLYLWFDKDLQDWEEWEEKQDVWSITKFQTFDHDLPALKSINILVNSLDEIKAARNLISRACSNLTKLEIHLDIDKTIDLSAFLKKNMIIETVWLEFCNWTKGKKIGKFLEKCPSIQSLILEKYDRKIKKVLLKNLTNLTLLDCGYDCTESILQLASKAQLITLQLSDLCHLPSDLYQEIMHQRYLHPDQTRIVIPSLERIHLSSLFLSPSEKANNISTLFPKEHEVYLLCYTLVKISTF